MNRFLMAASVAAICAGVSVQAQTNGLDPANLPPSGFDGREFVDSAGCAFLRSTFGGEVTWVPRYGPDRNPICDRSPTDFSTVAASTPASAATTTTTDAALQDAEADETAAREMAQEAPGETQTESRPSGRIEVVGAVADGARRPGPGFLGKEPAAAGVTPRRATPKPRLPQADASGRHPSCPASAPYGQLVDTLAGRKMVRCVTSPSLFLDEYAQPKPRAVAHAPRAAPGHGARIQVGSFGIASNAKRLVARLNARGLPASAHAARGLMVVTVGPFASGPAAHGALSTVRNMGFGDAFLRR
ncbi:MAG: hypothetical protein GVY34_03380 [Alphaproteobacteria bacterium]|jgi:cell division protein FtsN|nr:hypothetical protein [Alphaproteobacteria bacterium]